MLPFEIYPKWPGNNQKKISWFSLLTDRTITPRYVYWCGSVGVCESSQMIRFPDPMAGHKSVKFDFPDINSSVNNATKDRCPIPMDTTVRLGPLKFSLPAIIDHHGPSIHSGHYTASINCCKKTFYCNDHPITESGITDKNSSTAYIMLYKLIDTWFLDSNRRVGFWSLPWRWHIISIPLTTGRGTSAETCGLDDVLPPDDLGSRPEALC